MEIITKSAEETKELGRKIGSDLTSGKGGCRIFALTGNLGSGKTTFVQGFAEGLGVTSRIISPTFILMKTYKLQSGLNFYHLDLYRLENSLKQEIENLGLTDLWQNPLNIIIIEWAEKIKDLMPRGTCWVKFETMNENERRINIE